MAEKNFVVKIHSILSLICDVLCCEFRVFVWCDLEMRVCRLFCCMVWHYGDRWCTHMAFSRSRSHWS